MGSKCYSRTAAIDAEVQLESEPVVPTNEIYRPQAAERIHGTRLKPIKQLASQPRTTSHQADDTVDQQIKLLPEAPIIDPFRFTDLPIEIQLHIFRSLIQRSPGQDAAEKTTLTKATVSMLLLNKSSFHFFGPIRYQSTHIIFHDPVTFANNFLNRCTNLCPQNIRHLECLFGDRLGRQTKSTPPGLFYFLYDGDVKKLQEVLCLYTELRNLSEFNFRYLPELSGMFLYQDIAQTDRKVLWARLDRQKNNLFSNLERRLLARTFKGFSVRRGIVIDFKATSNGGYDVIRELGLTFRKGGAFSVRQL